MENMTLNKFFQRVVRFQHKVHWAMRNPTLNRVEFSVAQPIATVFS